MALLHVDFVSGPFSGVQVKETKQFHSAYALFQPPKVLCRQFLEEKRRHQAQYLRRLVRREHPRVNAEDMAPGEVVVDGYTRMSHVTKAGSGVVT